MRNPFVFYILLLSSQLVGQGIYIQGEQCQGFSSFIPNHGTFKIKYSYQKAGAAENIFEINSSEFTGPTVRQTFDASFLKIPVDINFKFGKRNIFSIGLGAYYSFNLTASYGTDSPNGTMYRMISLEQLGQNDYGLRFKPSV